MIFALILLGVLIITKDTIITTYLAVFIDLLGALPTFFKTLKHPETEKYGQWILAGISGLLSMFAVPEFKLVLIVYPFYIFIMNALIVGGKYYAESRIKKLS